MSCEKVEAKLDKCLDVCAVVAIIATILAVTAFNWPKRTSGPRLSERVSTLEQKMLEKTRPVIHADYATIYNTDGEIVIETFDKGE